MQNSNTSPIPVLEEIQKKVFLNTATFQPYYQKLAHSMAAFLNNTPVSSDEAEICMEKFNLISKSKPALYSLCQDTMMDLHDWAVTGDELTRARADVQLLYFFTHESPSTIKRKKAFLEKIKAMPRLNEKKSLLSEALLTLSSHYNRNNQENEDPNKGILSSLKDVLNTVSQSTKHYTRFEKSAFSSCAKIIQSHVPELYEKEWDKKFKLSPPQKRSVPEIKEAVDVCATRRKSSYNVNAARLQWERE